MTGTAAAPDASPREAPPPVAGPISRPELLCVALLALLAAALRLWRLGDLPPGLHVDEAFNLLDARDVIAGWRPAFLPANAGREVLLTYLQAPALALLGESPASARLVPALTGTLTVPAVWAFARGLRLSRAPRVALLAAAFTALSYWHLHFSRFGIRAVLFPMVVALTMWAWRRVVAGHASAGLRARRGNVLALGALLGLAVYTHPAGRFLAVVPALHAAWRWRRREDVAPARALIASVAIASVLTLPVTMFWARNPWAFTGHAGEVSILWAGPRALASNVLKVVGMFNVAGDPEAWRNLTRAPGVTGGVLDAAGLGSASIERALRGRPVFDPLAGALFLAGGALALAAARRGADWAVLALVWLGVLLLPSIVTDAAPNFSRTIGVIPVAFLLPALALDRAMATVGRRCGRVAAIVVGAGCLLVSGAWAVRDYFVVWAGDPGTLIAFDADKVALARYVDARAAEGVTVYLSPDLADHPTVRVTASVAPRGFDARHGLVLPPGGPAVAEYVLPADDPAWPSLQESVGACLAIGPIESVPVFRQVAARTVGEGRAAALDGRLRRGTIASAVSDADWTACRDLVLAAAAALALEAGGAPPDPDRIVFDGRIELLGARPSGPALVAVDDDGTDGVTEGTASLTTTVTLLWRAIAPVGRDVNALVHLHRAADGRGWGDGDGAPVGGSYPTSHWRPGELIVDAHVLTVRRKERLAGEAEVRVGWYDWQTGERLLLSDAPAGLRRENGTTVAIAHPEVVPPDG